MSSFHHYPAFVDNAQYISMDSSISESDQLSAMLANLTRIHLLTANKFDSFDALIHEYLISGIEIFGLETGIVSEISDDGNYRVCDVISPLEVLTKDMNFPLEDTYCKEVCKSQEVIGFPQVGNLEYMNCHPVYQNLRLEAYLSAPIYVEDSLFGTLNFTSTCARERGFSQHERNMIKLMANSIGAYILSRQKEDALRDLNDKMKRFIGYLAHDLRNPLGSILSFSKLALKPTISPEKFQSIVSRIGTQAERSLEMVTSILEAAALSTGKLTLEKSCVSARTLIAPAIESVLPFAQDSSILLKLDGELSAQVCCDVNRIQQSLTNLIINAIKYSPSGSEVLIEVWLDRAVQEPIVGHEDKRLCILSICNKVAGTSHKLSDDNSAVYRSIGFGLDIVTEVMSAHETRISQVEREGEYKVEFALPVC